MRYLKLLGLVVLVTAAVSAVAASGASATELCKANESPCAAANKYGAGTAIKLKLKSAKATITGTFLVECKKSSIEGKVTNAGSATTTVEASVSTMTFTECGNCTVTLVTLPSLEIHATGGGNGNITMLAYGMQVKCLGIECLYSGNVTGKITGTGGNPALITATKAVLNVIGGSGEPFCGTEGQWDAEYEVTTPKPLFFV